MCNTYYLLFTRLEHTAGASEAGGSGGPFPSHPYFVDIEKKTEIDNLLEVATPDLCTRYLPPLHTTRSAYHKKVNRNQTGLFGIHGAERFNNLKYVLEIEKYSIHID